MAKHLYDGDTFEHNGREYRVKFEHDACQEKPWAWCDGHGTVSEQKHHAFGMGSKPPKAPGERILVWDRGYYRTYDVAETMIIAKRDGWGLGDADMVKLAQSLGRKPTQKEIVAQAVENDFQHLRAWCNDEWSYVTVVVEHDESGETECLGMVESSDNAYLDSIARELADDIASRLDDEMAESVA